MTDADPKSYPGRGLAIASSVAAKDSLFDVESKLLLLRQSLPKLTGTPSVHPGTVLDKRYEVCEFIAAGGMAEVYLARELRMDSWVAIKIPRGRSDYSRRFQREVRITGKLPQHCAFVRALATGMHKGREFLVTDFVDGIDVLSLRSVLGRFAISTACFVAREAALGLAVAHASNIVHRDVTPRNLMLSGNGEVKIVDWGVATVGGESLENQVKDALAYARVTTFAGTSDYIAPEQWLAPSSVDQRADIYSLGCTLFEMLTGQAPFADCASSEDKRLAHQQRLPPSISTCRDDANDIAPIVAKCLAKNPADRFSSMVDLAEALRPFASLDRDDAAHVVVKEKRRSRSQNCYEPLYLRRSRSHGWGICLFASLVIALGIAGWTYLFGDAGLRPPGPPPPIQGNVGSRSPIPRLTTQRNPLSELALVSQPATIPGVESWTIETVGHRGAVTAVACRPGGDQIATSGEDGTVRVWRGEQRVTLDRIFVGHNDRVRALAWSPDGRLLASGSDDKIVRIWMSDKARLDRKFGHHDYVNALAFSPDGQRIAFGGGDGLIAIRGIREGDEQTVARPNGARTKGNLAALSWSVSGLAAAFDDGSVWIWPEGAQDGRLARRSDFLAAAGVAWLPDGKLGLVAGPTLEVRGATSGELIHSAEIQMNPTVAVAWSHDGKAVGVTTDGEAWVAGLDAAQINPSKFFGGKYSCVTWSGRGGVVLGGLDGSVEIRDSELKNTIAQTQGHPAAKPGEWGEIAVSPDERWLASAHADGTVRVWDTNRRVLHRMFRGNGDPASQIIWSSDSKHIVVQLTCRSPSSPPTCLAWEVESKEQWGPFSHAATCSPNGELIVAPSDPETLAVRSFRTGELLHSLNTGKRGRWLQISPDGRRLALITTERKLQAWNLETGKLLPFPQEDVTLADNVRGKWSPNGRWFAIDAQGFRVFEAETGQLRVLKDANACNFIWLPDGDTLVEGSMQDWHFWRSSDGQRLDSKSPNASSLEYLMGCSPDGAFFSLHDFWGNLTLRTREGQLGHFVRGAPYPKLAWLADGKNWAYIQGSSVRILNVSDFRVNSLLLPLGNEGMALSPQGHYRLSHPSVERELVYVVQTTAGQQLLTPARFAAQYDWHNDPTATAAP